VVTNTINFSVVGLALEKKTVIISGDTSGTVGEELVLNITVTNETANDWQFVLTDPDGLPDYTADYSGFPPLWALTPSKTGTYVLAVTVLTGSGNYSNTANLAISAASSNPEIPTVAFAGDGSGDFSFDVPTGYELFSVQGAGPALDEPNQQFVWSNLTLNVDYTVTGANLRILTDQSTARMIRIWLMEE